MEVQDAQDRSDVDSWFDRFPGMGDRAARSGRGVSRGADERDKAAAVALLSPEVLIFESGYVERSRTEYASHHLDGDIAFSKTASRKVLGQGERTEGKTAIVWQETETKGTSKGKEIHVMGTETAVLEKTGDKWTIVHVHWSSRKAK